MSNKCINFAQEKVTALQYATEGLFQYANGGLQYWDSCKSL